MIDSLRHPALRFVVLCFAFVASHLTLSSTQAVAQSASTLKIELYPEGQHNNPAVLFLNGKRYEPALQVPVPLTKSEVAPEVKFLGRVISTNRDGSLDEILSLWDAKERSDIRKVAADPSIFKSNKNFFRNITATRLLARVSYGSFEIFFVAHTLATAKIFVKEYPAIQAGGSLLLTNALQNDPMFMYLSTKYAQTLGQNLTADKQKSEVDSPMLVNLKPSTPALPVSQQTEEKQ
jgi:hypothetical protein